MIKSFLKYFARKLFEVGSHEFYLKSSADLVLKNEKNCIVDSTSNITAEARIENLTTKRDNLIIGPNCLVRGELLVFNFGGSINVGEYSFIGPGTRIWSCKSIRIGKRVLISHNVNIHDNNSHSYNAQDRHDDFVYMLQNGGLVKENDLGAAEIIIDDDVWIGLNSIILPGVHIGRGAIVGAGSVVTKSIPPYSVVVGNPGRVIRSIIEDDKKDI
jgi:acetyltransferase-like isoleucine patch superfamily enzyme